MAQGSRGKSGNIVEAHVETALRQCPNLGAEQQSLCTTRAATKPQKLVRDIQCRFRVGVCRQDKAHGVVLHVGGNRHLLNQLLQLDERGAINDRFDFNTTAFSCARHHFRKLIGTRVAHEQFVKEAVELCLGQRVGAFLVDRILRCQDKERQVEFADLATDRDTTFLHGFQHRRLGLWGGPVDFISQNQVGKNRPVLKLKSPFSIVGFVYHVGAQNIRRHEVGRELDAVERQVEHLA